MERQSNYQNYDNLPVGSGHNAQKTEHKTLWQRIKAFIVNILNKLGL